MTASEMFAETDIQRTVHRASCIVICAYNDSQQDALFLYFILVKNSTCFGQTYRPSSGVLILYSILISLADSQHNQYDKYQLL